MHNPEPFIEKEMQNILWDFEKQTDHLISARRPDFETVNKKQEKLPESGLCRLKCKIERRQKEIST